MRKPCESRQREQPVQRSWGKTVPNNNRKEQSKLVGERVANGKSDRAGDREESEVTVQTMQGLVEPEEDLGVYSKSGGSNGGFQPEEGHDLTQAFTDALLPIWGGQNFLLESVARMVSHFSRVRLCNPTNL